MAHDDDDIYIRQDIKHRLRISINQSINQSNFYATNIPCEARVSGTTSESVFNSKIEETVP